MMLVHEEMLASQRVPDLDAAIRACRRQAQARWRPGDGQHSDRTKTMKRDDASARDIPDACRAIATGCGQVLAIRGPFEIVYRVCLTSIRADVLSASSI